MNLIKTFQDMYLLAGTIYKVEKLSQFHFVRMETIYLANKGPIVFVQHEYIFACMWDIYTKYVHIHKVHK